VTLYFYIDRISEYSNFSLEIIRHHVKKLCPWGKRKMCKYHWQDEIIIKMKKARYYQSHIITNIITLTYTHVEMVQEDNLSILLH
jgi:hypothetical protein